MREQQKFKNTTYDGFHTLYIKLFVNVKLILTSFYLRVNMNWLYECQQQISAMLSHRILIIADVTGKLGWIGVVIESSFSKMAYDRLCVLWYLNRFPAWFQKSVLTRIRISASWTARRRMAPEALLPLYIVLWRKLNTCCQDNQKIEVHVKPLNVLFTSKFWYLS